MVQSFVDSLIQLKRARVEQELSTKISKRSFYGLIEEKVLDVVSEKQLCSIMNNTKWEKLQSGVLNTLPFPPPFQVKYVLEDTPIPATFENDMWYWGDWEGLFPFYSVEWIRVRPRYLPHNLSFR